jgi:hypothetical protein
MADDPTDSARFSLHRWSRRKLDAARDGERALQAPASDARAPPRADGAGSVPTGAQDARAPQAPPLVAPGADTGTQLAETALPPVESLTFDSDFTAFMRPGVDADLRRSAVRKLVRDPRFNVMDGLDVYIDDYSIPSPMEPELAQTLMQARYIFNPPQTRVNEQGIVEDVPPDDVPTQPDPATPAGPEGIPDIGSTEREGRP